jgi:hypothetical protein
MYKHIYSSFIPTFHLNEGKFSLSVLINKNGNGNSRPNFTVEWLALLLRIREVPGSNLGPETRYIPWRHMGGEEV